MATNDIMEMLAEEYDRISVLDAALGMHGELRDNSSSLRLLMDTARDDARKAIHKLVDCDPEDSKSIRKLQWEVQRFDALCVYVFNVLEAGKAAASDLTEEELAETERLLGEDDTTPKD